MEELEELTSRFDFDVEFYYQKNVSKEMRAENYEIKGAVYEHSEGIGVRVLKDGKIGFSYTTNLDNIEDTVKRAERMSKFSENVSLSFPNMKPRKVSGLYNKKIPDMGFSDMKEMLKLIIDVEKGVEPIINNICLEYGEREILNTNGFFGKERYTYFMAYASVKTKGLPASTGYDYLFAREIPENMEKIGENARELALMSRNPKKINSGIYDVILKPKPFAELMNAIFIPSISAERVRDNLSYLKGKLNEEVFSSELTVYDDGRLKAGFGSCKFDGEGIPAKRKRIISKGVLESYLYDLKTSAEERKNPTGNGIREDFSEMPSISETNLIVEKGSSIDYRGIVVNELVGVHTSNSLSGEFSLQLGNSFLNGTPIKEAMVYGNLFEVLKDLKVGNDVENAGTILTPSVKTKLKVTG